MDSFDLSNLTGTDFEYLCKDIFEAELDVRLEVFAEGRDRGIDLRHLGGAALDEKPLVIQCKQWYRSGASKLLQHYSSSESAKVAALGEVRYIVATSADMTVEQKQALAASLGSKLEAIDDIWEGGDVASFLEGHPEIVKRHLRLWLTSSAILRAALQQDIEFRTRSLNEEIEQNILTYAQGSAYIHASAILEKEKVCLISGIPGAGKSALAKALVAQYAADGYEIIDLSGRVQDVDRAWTEDTPQVFYVDDFLGHTVLDEPATSSAGRSVLPLISRVRKAPGKAIIMTTRDFILRQASERSEFIRHHNFTPAECVVAIEDLSERDKARILYNHVSQSNLEPGQKEEFAKPAAYLEIIRHPNYSPRLIQHALTEVLDIGSEEGAVEAVLSNLANPRRLWETLIENVMDDAEAGLLMSLFSLGGDRIDLETLKTAWHSYMGHIPNPSNSKTFRNSLRRLEKTMIRDVGRSNAPLYSLHNPSLEDYLVGYLETNTEIISNILSTAVALRQLEVMVQYAELTPGHAFSNSIRASGDSLAGVLRAALDKITGKDEFPDTRVLLVCAQLANITNSQCVAEVAASRFDAAEVDVEYWDQLPDIIAAVHSSQFPRLHEHKQWMADAYLEYAVQEYGWEDLRHAKSELESLAHLGVSTEDAESSVIESMLEVAIDAVEIFAGDSEPPSLHIDENLEEMVEMLDEYAVDCDGLAEARLYLELREPPSTSRPVAQRSNEMDLTKMFSELAEGNDH